MKIIIIGGTGLISVAITQFLLDRGDEVFLFNRGQSTLPADPRAKVITGDRTDFAGFEAQIHALDCFDVVIDMVGFQPGDGASAVRAFVGRTGQFIFCSTVDVYRKPAFRYPVVESEPYGGLNAYSRNKVILEKQLLEAQSQGAFPLTIIRPAYTYGESRGPVHSLGGRTYLLDRIRRGKPIIVHGDGSSFWTACYRDDVARAFVAAAGNPLTFGRNYHVTGEEWLTWDRYIHQIAEALHAPEPEIVHIPTDILARLAPKNAGIVAENFQFNNVFDNRAAKNDLGFCYHTPWVQGVRRMAAWLDDHHGIENCDQFPFYDRLIAVWQAATNTLSQDFNEG